MAASRPGWQQAGQDGSQLPRMAARRPGWQLACQDGSQLTRMAASWPGTVSMDWMNGRFGQELDRRVGVVKNCTDGYLLRGVENKREII